MEKDIELKTEKDFKYWLRWVLVFPGALIAGFLATFPLHWILGLLFALHGKGEEVDVGTPGFFVDLFRLNADMIEYFLYPVVIAVTFILIGYKIAPKYKFKTALVLFGIYVTAWLVGIFFTAFKGDINMQIPLRAIIALLGASLGLYEAKRLDKKDKAFVA